MTPQNAILYDAVLELAKTAQLFSDADLSQPYAWRRHGEGIRMALLGTNQELHDLALQRTKSRLSTQTPFTAVHQLLAQNHVGYRALQALFLAVDEALYDQLPGLGQWPLRTVLGHIVGAERAFHTLVVHGLRHQRAGERPPPLPDDAVAELFESYSAFSERWLDGSQADLLSYYDRLHFQSWQAFATMTDDELAAPSPVWWEDETYSLQYRLLRFDAHLQQHLIQAQKTLRQLGQNEGEATRLIQLLFRSLADCESVTIGAPDVGNEETRLVADRVRERAVEIAKIVNGARDLETAVRAADREQVQSLLREQTSLVNSIDQQGVSLVLTATYNGQPEIAQTLVEAGAELSAFSAAAMGELARLQELAGRWPGYLNEFGPDGFTPLQLACYFNQEATALWLIEQGAAITAVAQNGMRITPLHAAAAAGNVTLMAALLAQGAAVNARQEGGYTVLHEAARRNDVAMIDLCLAHGADRDLTTDAGLTPLALALADDHAAAVRRLQATAA